MDFFINHWYSFLAILVLVCGGCIAAYKFSILDKEQRYESIRGWLLQAVLIAEKTFGGGTGRLKLSSVYDKFCERFPVFARVVSFGEFSEYVDDALHEMHEILESNKAIASLVENKEE